MPKYYTKESNSIKLPPFVAKKLELIGREYFLLSKKKMVVTSGNREPKNQARLLYIRFYKHKKFDGYRQTDLLDEIIAVYYNGILHQKNRMKIIEDMAIQIKKQISRKRYLSRYLNKGAVDIRVKYGHMPNKNQRDAFIEIAKIYGAKTALDETDPPHIHLGF